MGGGSSTPSTPLACMLKGFEKYYNKTQYKVPYPPVTRERLKYLCQKQWPHLGTGWPTEGSFKCQTISDLWNLIAPPRKGKGKRLDVATKRVKDVKVSETKVSDTKKQILAQEEETILRPPPYAPPPHPGAPPPPQPQAGDEDDQAEGADGEPVVRPKAKKQSKRGRPPKSERVEEDPEVENEEEGAAATAVGVTTRAAAAKAEAAAAAAQDEFVAPLRQMDQQVVNPQGVVEYRPCFQYVPFSTTDLLNWKQHYGPLSSKPTEMADLFQTIMQTHNPNWQDVQQLLNALLTPEEREKWKAAVRTCMRERFPNMADVGPNWRFGPLIGIRMGSQRGKSNDALREYQTLTVEALRRAGKPPVNMSKPSLIMQRADESPESFLQRLIEAYELYTQVDPRQPENVRMLNERFIADRYEDIRKKLQKLEGALGKNTTELLEVARKVFVNRDKVEKKERDARMHKKTELLAVALQGGRTLGPNQWGPGLEQAPPEPLVTMNIGGQQTTFLVDTGAGRSVVNNPITAPGIHQIRVQGVSGQVVERQVLQPVTCTYKGSKLQHEFLYIPECPIPLLGRDMLSKLGATISFNEGKQSITVSHDPDAVWRLMVAQATEDRKWEEFGVPELWAEDNPPGFAAHHPPVIVEVKPYATPVHIRQRPCSREALTAIYEIIQKFLKAGILVPIQSPWNTPILPIRKPDGVSFRPVQDLRIINDVTVTIHPAVPNPYTLLSLIPPKAKWFSVIDLKDAFFTIPIHPVSQPLFAFEWENPTTGTKLQYTWTRLPQGFKNSPTLFGTALGRDLQYYVPRQKGDTVLQYVDDVLVTGQTEDLCWENTKALFVLLVECGYRASRNKAQLVKQRVRYLGYDIEQGKRSLGPERKEAVLAIAEPTTRRQLRGFLGLAGFCRIWIPNFALLAAPLYASTKGGNSDEFVWTEEQSRAFKEIKKELTRAPALALPNLEKPFNLYVDTKQNIALGVLTQQLGAWQRPIAYLSKQLDGVAKGWPHCLKVLAAIAELLQDCNKLTLSCAISVHTPHAVQSVLDNKGHLWISNQRLVKYQAMMIENPHVRLHVSTRLNPATLLPIETTLEHDCLHVLDNVYSTRPDLSDIPLPHAKYNWYTDGSSYMHEGKRVAGYAIVDDSRVIESGPLGSKRSAQVAELWALIRALNRAEDETLNVWTDSKYAFLTLHAHGAVYKERGFRDSAGKFIQHGHLIQYLIDAVKKPKKVSVMHCKGHQRGDDRVALGNRAADLEAPPAALRDDVTPDLSILIAQDLSVIPPTIKPSYSQAECAKAVNDLKADLKDGWYTLECDIKVIEDVLGHYLVVGDTTYYTLKLCPTVRTASTQRAENRDEGRDQQIATITYGYSAGENNNVCVRNMGQWSPPEDRPRITQSYAIGIGDCGGPPPLTFTPECWTGTLPHPCQHPRVFDKIATEACRVRRPINPEACRRTEAADTDYLFKPACPPRHEYQ
ncbi:uncharacterized protein LOC131194178 [Ahaetulla prasina]|uniref:uncharacterized protein LOC131194178 n=1 Tax=Ahaetulla prasina TaxID=499056 RepID=UPI002648ECE0|nr:uncharacterized protein LOC131194178 [Ahaetulla prasina]